ncbi:MAG: sulfite exporter TauE/SafE family protein [Candidatus Methanomethyliaceae archaeon]|nr:sulfite exporter TauE/SafE family protein [Candidatus Methanomethyliaceae archaeon]MDW7970593.1 sulfite exporter TauE/SafE family protein [Nitrososphaerota archaeon]
MGRMLELILFAFGIISGTINTMLGMGAGTFMIILLTFINIPIKIAVPLSLLSILFSSIIGTIFYFRRGMIKLKLAILLQSSAAIGAMLGAMFLLTLPSSLIELLLAIVLFHVAFLVLLYNPCNSPETMKCRSFSLGLGLFFSFIAGVISSTIGIGGGIISVPVMNLVMNVPINFSVATSNFMIGLTALVGVLIYYIEGILNFQTSIPVIIGAILGALLGTRYMIRNRPNSIRIMVGILILIFGIILLLRRVALILV